MKILVIDDKAANIESAISTLIGHDVDTANSYQEGLKKIGIEKEGGILQFGKCVYDVVFTDMNMPVDTESYKGDGKEELAGWSLALLATRQGAKRVVVVSDANHHHDAGSAMMDFHSDPLEFANGGKLFFCHAYSKDMVDTNQGAGKNWAKFL